MKRLPPELLFLIFKYIPDRQLFKFLRVSKIFNDVITRNTKRLPKPTVIGCLDPSDFSEETRIDGKDAELQICSIQTREDEWTAPPTDIHHCITIRSTGLSFDFTLDEHNNFVERRQLATLVAHKFGGKVLRRGRPHVDYFVQLDDVRAAYRYIFNLIAEKVNFQKFTMRFCDNIQQVHEDLFDTLHNASPHIESFHFYHRAMSCNEIINFHNRFGTTSFVGAMKGCVDELFSFQDSFTILNGGRLQGLENFFRLLENWKAGTVKNIKEVLFDFIDCDAAVQMVQTLGAALFDLSRIRRINFTDNVDFELSRESDDLKLWISFKNGGWLRIVGLDPDMYCEE